MIVPTPQCCQLYPDLENCPGNQCDDNLSIQLNPTTVAPGGVTTVRVEAGQSTFGCFVQLSRQ
ncbi:MAG: hypothetical protein ACREMA_05890, partial [Longimicrobiales bacterium]